MWKTIRNFSLGMIGLTSVCIYLYFFHPTKKTNKPIQNALLLGCPSHDDGSYSSSQIKRCQLAIDEYQKGHYDTLIISGSNVKNQYVEAEAMARYIHERINMPILLETKAKNTYENLKYTKEMIGDVPLLILTSSLHGPRALAIARQFFSDSHTATYPDQKPKHIWREILSRIVFIQIEMKKKLGLYP